jgi:monothiol bacilliredoxin
MSLLKKIFAGKRESKAKKILPWISLHLLEQLEEISKKSKTKTQLIFKHSTRCGVSRMVLNQFENKYNISDEDVDLYFLDLINYREVSNQVGYKFQVMHQSPQLLVIKNDVVVAHESHAGVNEIELDRFI